MPETGRNERVINVADIDPQYRHAILSRLFEHLSPDSSLQIVVDHDPRRLRLQLEARHGSRCDGHIWRKAPMSGAFACACSAAGARTMANSVSSASGVPIRDPGRHGKSGRYVDGYLSRTERMEIITHVAAAGMRECSAGIVRILERSDENEDPEWSDGDVEQRIYLRVSGKRRNGPISNH